MINIKSYPTTCIFCNRTLLCSQDPFDYTISHFNCYCRQFDFDFFAYGPGKSGYLSFGLTFDSNGLSKIYLHIKEYDCFVESHVGLGIILTFKDKRENLYLPHIDLDLEDLNSLKEQIRIAIAFS